ncbi:ABC transporter permease [Brachybacterium sp. J153]|uniref:ABC transporter permease n=1 Tax=Brachybacterium sp. J153 TaxID=3116488 RepID=UPI002E7691D6|nr:ABC transporter permease [Brachybacterium sp. J153]MEE1617855.1 ABC transporter permease [Brachybacterium sp. J153]
MRPPLGTYLRELWERRHFIWYDARQRSSTQNTSTRLGNVWLFLRPLIDAAFYWVIFGVLMGVDRGVDNFPAFLIIGLLMFRATGSAISSGAMLMRGSKSMIRAFNFPRAAVPISSVLQASMSSVATMIVICFAITIIPPFAPPNLMWPLIIPIFLLQALLNLGITFITARIGFHLPDMANVLSVVSRFLMYGSGVIFPIEAFIKHPTIREIVMLNPVYRILDMSRTVLIDGAVPALDSWLILGAWVLVLLVGGFVYFSRGEEIYGRELR